MSELEKQPPRGPVRRRSWHARFLVNLKKTRGNMTEAAKAIPVDPATVYRHMQKDAAFAKQVRDMLDTVNQVRIAAVEDLVYEHITEGVAEPVFQGGVMVGAKKIYDHRLAVRWLEAHDPDKWRKTETVEHHGAGGGPIKFVFNLGDSDEPLEGEAIEDAEHLELPEGDPE